MSRKYQFNFIYKTTNTLNGNFYIGMHSTDVIEDGYLGSGKRLWYSLRKYGAENHIREILEFADDRITLKNREREIVNEGLLEDPKCLNLVIGGNGGFTLEACKKGARNGAAKAGKIGGKKCWLKRDKEEFRQWSSTTLKRTHAEGKIPYGTFKGKTHSEDARRRIGEKSAIHQKGSGNSQYGIKRAWIRNDKGELKKVLLCDLDEYLSNGWKRGIKEPKEAVIKEKIIKDPYRNYSDLTCEICMKVFKASPRDVRRNRRFCSLDCSYKGR